MSFLMLLHQPEVWDEEGDFVELYLRVSLTLHVRFTRAQFCSGVGSLGAPVLGEQITAGCSEVFSLDRAAWEVEVWACSYETPL